MTTEADQKLKKVQKYSVSFRRLFQFLSVMVALALVVQTLLFFTGAEPYGTSVSIGNIAYSGDSIPSMIRRLAWLETTLGLALLLKLNFHLIRLFDLYAAGRLFNREKVHQIRQMGITVLLFPALWVLGLIVPAILPADHIVKSVVSNGQDPFAQLIVGAIIIVVAWIMDVGRELREEQDLVV